MERYNFCLAQRLFGVGEEEAHKVIAAALSKGGEYADLFFQQKEFNSTVILDSKVTSAGHYVDFGVGIRVIKGEHTGYAYCENTRLESMLDAALIAAQIAGESGSTAVTPKIFAPLSSPERYPILKGWEEFGIESKIPILNYLDKRVRELEADIESFNAKITDSRSRILFFNSEGESFCDERPYISVIARAVVRKNGGLESGNSSRSFMKGFEMLTLPLMDEMAEEIVRRALFQFKATQPKGGSMPVVMAAGGSGILLHEAMGHAFEADFNRKGVSIFSEKMGQEICNREINIVDSGVVEGNRGAVNFDDEGVVGQKTYMVKDGILNSYLHDRISARHYGVAPTGNGRRESFRFNPIPRMRLTYMEPGSASEEDIIAEVKSGIYCSDFASGQVDIGGGDFSFFVKSGYLIEKGHLTAPVKDINIIGNGPQALSDIVAVGNRLEIENGKWVCSKGQQMPVSCGMPTVLVKNLSVGGKA